MLNARRGEVWLVDLGMAAKARPAVILSIPFSEQERALYAIVPHTTATRAGRFEVVVDVPWLQSGAFDVQGLRNIPGSVFLRRLGALNQPQMALIVQATKLWLGIVQG
jgi:mRNA interferase MazF